LEISKRLAAPFWEHDNLKGERGEADVPSDAKAERGGIRADLATPGLTIEGFSTL
jgi:hypothetical protein